MLDGQTADGQTADGQTADGGLKPNCFWFALQTKNFETNFTIRSFRLTAVSTPDELSQRSIIRLLEYLMISVGSDILVVCLQSELRSDFQHGCCLKARYELQRAHFLTPFYPSRLSCDRTTCSGRAETTIKNVTRSTGRPKAYSACRCMFGLWTGSG